VGQRITLGQQFGGMVFGLVMSLLAGVQLLRIGAGCDGSSGLAHHGQPHRSCRTEAPPIARGGVLFVRA